MAHAQGRPSPPQGNDGVAQLSRPTWMARLLHETPPLPLVAQHPAYLWFVVGTVCIGAFMGQLDASIAQQVLPELTRVFAAPLGAVEWVSIAYLLTLASLLAVVGRLADMVGRKALYTLGFLVFIVGSALCGAAPSLNVLIGARVLQAVGAAMLQANSVALIAAAAGSAHLGRAIGIQATAQAVGLSLGPALGGLLITTLGWRWVFFITVLPGIAGAILGWLVLPVTAGTRARQRFDLLGALLFAVGLTSLLAALTGLQITLTEQRIAWPTSTLAGLALLAALSLIAFAALERHTIQPLIDFTLLRSGQFTVGILAGLLSYAVLFGVFFLLPFYMSLVLHLSALQGGLVLTSVPVALGLTAPYSGALSDRLGARLLTALGIALSGVALLALAVVTGSLLTTTTTLIVLVPSLIVFGVGQGAFTPPNNSAIMKAAPPHQLGMAAGLLNITRTAGTSMGIAISGVVLAIGIALVSHPAASGLRHTPLAALLPSFRGAFVALALLAFIAAGISFKRHDVATDGPGFYEIDSGI